MSSLEFCEAIQPVLNDLDSEVNICLMDDVSLSSDVSTLEKDINTIIEAESSTGLRFNPAKCEIIMQTSAPTRQCMFSKTLYEFRRTR